MMSIFSFLSSLTTLSTRLPRGPTHDRDRKIIIAYLGKDKSVSLPYGLERIGAEAFRECTSLQSIVIPEGVTYIDDFAFMGCKSLEMISLPRSLSHRAIGYIFDECDSLTSIVIPLGTRSYFEELLPKFLNVSNKLVEQ